MNLLNILCKNHNVALAVSGGVDSMALAYLVTRYISPSKIHAFTVDHSARPESHDEAITVRRNLLQLGIHNHHILELDWKKQAFPTTKFELEARKLRRNIMVDKCRELGINHLFLAHHWNDQLETFLLRLIRGSSLFGLSGMHEISYDNNIIDPNTSGPVVLVKPLLHHMKNELYQLCLDNKIPWVEDPTNTNPKLTIRNSIRFLSCQDKYLPSALQIGNLTRILQKLRQKRSTCENETKQILKQLSENNKIRLDKDLGRLQCELPADYHHSWSSSAKTLFMYQLFRQVSPLALEYRLSMVNDFVHYFDKNKEKIPTYGNVSIKYQNGILNMSRARIFRYQRRSLRTKLSLSKAWSQWVLFDNRYWIRAKCNTNNTTIEISLLFDSSAMKTYLSKRLGIGAWPSRHLLDTQPFVSLIPPSAEDEATPLGFPLINKFDESHGIQIEWKYKTFASSASHISTSTGFSSGLSPS